MKVDFSRDKLFETLKQAWDAHREYQKVYMHGVYDEEWPGWYAAYVLGRLGDFTTPSRLTVWLANVPNGEDWLTSAVAYIFEQIHAE